MDKVIRVAQVIGKCSTGGVESMIMNLYRNIDHSKVVFDFFVENTSLIVDEDEIKSYGGSVKIVPKYSKIFKFRKTLYRYFREGNYDIVHANMNAQSFLALSAAKKAGIKVRIAHSHTTTNKKEGLRYVIKSILRLFSKLHATHYFACSEKAGLWLFGNKIFNANKIVYISSSIDFEKFKFNDNVRNSLRKSLGFGKTTKVLGHIGRFAVQKNHTFLIDIMEQLSSDNYKLCLIGVGPDLELIRKLVEQKRLSEKVIFVGEVGNPQDYYNVFDAFLLPSLYEGFPVVGIEAQANGLQCYFSDTITKEANITNTVCYLPISSAQDWANRVSSDSLSRFNINDIGSYDIKYQANKLEKIYEDILNG